MKRRTLATLKLAPNELIYHANREALAEALITIAREVMRGEHLASTVLAVYESDAVFTERERRRAVNTEALDQCRKETV